MDFNNIPFRVLSVSAFREYLTSLWGTLRFDFGVIMPGAGDTITEVQAPCDYKSILSFFFSSNVVDTLMPVFSTETDQGKLSTDDYSRLTEAMYYDDFHQPASLPERWAKTLANRQEMLVNYKASREQYSAETASKITSQRVANLQEQLKKQLEEDIEALEKPFIENALAAVTDVTNNPLTDQLIKDYGIDITRKDDICTILALLWVWISALPHKENAERAHQDFIQRLQLRIRALVPVNEFSPLAQEAVHKHMPNTPVEFIVDLISKNVDQPLNFTDQSAIMLIAYTNDPDNTPTHRK